MLISNIISNANLMARYGSLVAAKISIITFALIIIDFIIFCGCNKPMPFKTEAILTISGVILVVTFLISIIIFIF